MYKLLQTEIYSLCEKGNETVKYYISHIVYKITEEINLKLIDDIHYMIIINQRMKYNKRTFNILLL